jgi:hypothetical protein
VFRAADTNHCVHASAAPPPDAVPANLEPRSWDLMRRSRVSDDANAIHRIVPAAGHEPRAAARASKAQALVNPSHVPIAGTQASAPAILGAWCASDE